MLSAAHTLISVPIGMHLQHPAIIFAIAFLLHLVADGVLHWNIYPHPDRPYPVLAVATDVLGGVVLAWLITGDLFWTAPVLAAIAGGNAPDVLHGLWEMLPAQRRASLPAAIRWPFELHDGMQLETTNPVIGLLPQVLLVGLALTWLIV